MASLIKQLDELAGNADELPMPWHHDEDGNRLERDCFLTERVSGFSSIDTPQVRDFVVGLVNAWPQIREVMEVAAVIADLKTQRKVDPGEDWFYQLPLIIMMKLREALNPLSAEQIQEPHL